MRDLSSLLRASVLLGASVACFAQVDTGSVTGSVVDPSGKPVARVQVVATEVKQNWQRNAFTDSAGFFRIINLSPGDYSVTVKAPGFDAPPAAPATVPVAATVRVDVHLALSVRRESIEVRAQADPLAADAVAQSALLGRERLDRLPLNRRDFLQLALLAPGVSPPVENSELSTRGAFAMHASGAREEFNNFLLDGVDNNDPYVNRYVVQPAVDSIQEFRIATSTYSAEYGRNAGGQVNVVTRRGGASWHGAAYEYFRNRALDASNYFDRGTKPQYTRNQFGGTVGGPVRKDKTYIFASVDLLRERQGWTKLVSVPGPAERGGDFSAYPTPVIDLFARAPFPGNRIPAIRISPVGAQVVSLFPLPNLPGSAGNFLAQPVFRGSSSQASIRGDHISGPRDQISVRYNYGLADLYEPFTEDSEAVPGFGDLVRDPAHNAMVSYEHYSSPSLTNSLRAGFSRLSRELMPESRGSQPMSFPWLAGGSQSGYPMFTVAGYSSVGDATSLPIRRQSSTYQLGDTLAYVRGRHFLKAGGEIRFTQLDSRLDLLTRGSLSFSGMLSGFGMSDLLLGWPSFGLRAQADNPMALRSTAYNLFAQDDWRLRPGLTLTFGLRYEYNTPPVDTHDGMSTLDWKTGLVNQVGTAGLSRSGLSADRNNFGPRAGFAWEAGKAFTVRGGYGVYFDSGALLAITSNYFNPPQFNLRVYFPSERGLLSLADPFPLQGGFVPPPSLSVLNPDFVNAYMQHWSLSLQRSFGASGSLDLSYVGTKGTNLLRARDVNQPPPGPGDVQDRRPYPQFGSIILAESGANSSYQALQAGFQSRPSRYGSVWMAYTFSKSIDSASAFLSTRSDKNFPQDSAHANLEHGLSSFNLAHRLAASYIIPLPRGSVWTRNTELRGIAVAEAGRPFTSTLRFDNSNTGNTGGNFGSDRPNALRNPSLGNPTPEKWFDTSAFEVAPEYQFGNAGRNTIGGPSYFSFDVALAREFMLHERIRLTAEAQAFNLFNRANFNLPSSFADEPSTFGRIFSAGPGRQIQLALRLTF